MDTKDIVTAITAIVGACTGSAGLVISLLNHHRAVMSERVRLRVSVLRCVATNGSTRWIAIEVINLSVFDVTLAEVGFRQSNGRAIAFLSSSLSMGRLPHKLEPRRKATFDFPPGIESQPAFSLVLHAYARCEDDEVSMGDSDLLRQLVQQANATSNVATEQPGDGSE